MVAAVTASRRITIAPYSEQWPSEFATVEGLLREALRGAAVRIDHIGSTSVPGLAAKDVIDVQVGVADPERPTTETRLRANGCHGNRHHH
jgi:GrpB-like predicted nucleotidyltransferase (UPF0157 family)